MTRRRYWLLVDQMARMSLKADASRYFLGYIWWLLEPLLFVGVFYLVFGVLLGAEREDFLVFLMCGKLTFVWFSKSVAHAGRSIVAAQGLIGSVDLPKSLFPMTAIQEGLYKQATVMLLLFLLVVAAGYGAGWHWLWLLPILLANYLLIVACGLLAAFLVCLFFDFMMVIQLGMTFLLFVSGIFWDPRSLPDPAATEWLFIANPLAFLIDAYRQVLMVGVAPDASLLLGILLTSALAVALMLGLLRRQSQFLALRALTI